MYEEFVRKTAEEIEIETQEDNKDFPETTVEFNKVDFKVSEDKEKKEITDLFHQIKENEEPIDPEVKDLFVNDNNSFENDDITAEDKKFIMDLIDRTDFSPDRKFFKSSKDSNKVLSKMGQRLSLKSMRKLLI